VSGIPATVCKCSLESHQFRPFNSCIIAPHPLPIHAPNPINQSSCSDQHFLGVTSTKSAGSAKRVAIYDGHTPSSGSALVGGCGRGSPGADDHEVKLSLRRASKQVQKMGCSGLG
jgi:hypothetical protein